MCMYIYSMLTFVVECFLKHIAFFYLTRNVERVASSLSVFRSHLQNQFLSSFATCLATGARTSPRTHPLVVSGHAFAILTEAENSGFDTWISWHPVQSRGVCAPSPCAPGRHEILQVCRGASNKSSRARWFARRSRITKRRSSIESVSGWKKIIPVTEKFQIVVEKCAGFGETNLLILWTCWENCFGNHVHSELLLRLKSIILPETWCPNCQLTLSNLCKTSANVGGLPLICCFHIFPHSQQRNRQVNAAIFGTAR